MDEVHNNIVTNMILGASDFLGINHYTTFQVSAGSGNSPLFLDAELNASYDDSWPKTSAPWLRVSVHLVRHVMQCK